MHRRLTNLCGHQRVMPLILSVVMIAAGAVVGGCGGSSDDSSSTSSTGGSTAAEASKPIAVGAAIAKSGYLEQIDGGPYAAAKLAIDDINAEGGLLGRQIELTTKDTKSEPNQAAQAATELVDQGIEVLLATCDYDFGSPAGIVAEQHEIVNFTLCAESYLWGPKGIGPLAFTPSPLTSTEGVTMAEWAYETGGFKKAFVLRDESIRYPKEVDDAFATRFEELGGEVVEEDSFQNEDSNIGSQISNIKQSGADLIFICTYPPGGPQAVRQIRAAGIETPIGSCNSMDGDYWLEAVPNLSNFYYDAFGSIYGDDPRPEVNKFFKRYAAETGTPPPNAYPLMGYTAVEAWAQAVEEAGTTEGPAVAKALEGFKGVELLGGLTSYTADVHAAPNRPQVIMEVQNGKHKFVELRTPKSVPVVVEGAE